MSCYKPLLALDLGVLNENGKKKIKILPKRYDQNLEYLKEKYGDSLLRLPCGHCVGCLQDYKQSWAVRILLEASLYENNCFITLTYRDECLPKDNRPHRDEIVRFIKRLRKAVGSFRIFYCGEKGSETGRAHYHAIIFGYDFPDKVFHSITSKGSNIYTSKILDKCWSFGFASIGEVAPGSACYVAMYANKKKLTGVNDGSFIGMSRMPGIGSDLFNMRWFKSDTIYCALGEPTIPRFYHKMLEGLDPLYFDEWKKGRKRRASQRVGAQALHGFRTEDELLNYDEDIKIRTLLKKGSLYL